MDNNEPPSIQQPISSAQENNLQQQSTPVVITPQEKPKKSKKPLIILLLILILAAGGGFYAYTWHKNKSTAKVSSASGKPNGISLQSSEKPGSKTNITSQSLAFGFISYTPEKFSNINSNLSLAGKLEKLGQVPTETGFSTVAFLQTSPDTYTTNLLMYDFKTKITYSVVTETGLVRHFYDPVIMSNHYVSYYTLTYKDPVTLEGSVNIVDLLTGQKKQIITNTAGNLPANLCCSVSPNGLFLAVPNPPNKLDFYTAGGDKTSELTLTISFLPKIQGGNSQDSYAQAQLAAADNYPIPRWLDDSHMVLANSPPINYTSGTSEKTTNNGLSILDISTNQLKAITQLKNYAINWFDISGNTLVFAAKGNLHETGNVANDLEQLKTKLYKINITTAGGTQQPELLNFDFGTGGASGPYALDKTAGILYTPSNNNYPLVALDIKNNTSKGYQAALTDSLIGVLDSDTLITGTTDVTNTNPKLELYNLSTGQTIQVY